jgi:hypothetical protein
MLSEAYEGEAMKPRQVFLRGINSSKTAHKSKSQMKAMLVTFFNIKGKVYFEFIPQGQTVNQAPLCGNIEAVMRNCAQKA